MCWDHLVACESDETQMQPRCIVVTIPPRATLPLLPPAIDDSRIQDDSR
jgi:hypothetical protein